jgi:phytoene synthase
LEAEKDFKYIPRRYLIPIKTASDMYKWTAAKIRENPFIIFKEKVKPSKLRIIMDIIKNIFWIKV